MENATLILRTKDAVSSSNNSQNTWNNINLRILLGTMYDKYEMFNLCLVNISTGASNSLLGNTTDDLNVAVNISGIPFINQTYNALTGNNTTSSTITTFQFQKNLCVNQYFYGSNYITFGKSQDQCNLSINLSKVSDYSTVLNAGITLSYPNVSYIFSIIGIPNQNDKTLTPQSRMDNNKGKL